MEDVPLHDTSRIMEMTETRNHEILLTAESLPRPFSGWLSRPGIRRVLVGLDEEDADYRALSEYVLERVSKTSKLLYGKLQCQ